jgi:predicted enzyme related to lactoylglutathione lyase
VTRPPLTARYAHTNLVARDWRRLAAFYEAVFGCTPVPPERDLKGEWLARGSGVPAARLRGIHLRLPGYGDGGPTLELFQYESRAAELSGKAPKAPRRKAPPRAADAPGYGHIAFEVGDVERALDALVKAGGSTLGEVVTVQIAGAGTITWTYARDPEGNILELQHWERANGRRKSPSPESR